MSVRARLILAFIILPSSVHSGEVFMKVASSLALLLLLCALSNAQTANTGAIAGVVTDPNQALIASVQVTATNQATGETRSTLSQANGTYTIPLLPPGAYRVEFKKAAFKNAVKTGIR